MTVNQNKGPLILFISASLVAFRAFGMEGVYIPDPDNPSVSFEKKNVALECRAVANGDRAKAVVDQGLLLVGAKNAGFTILKDADPDALKTVRIDGHWIIHAGSTPFRLQAGTSVIEVRQVEMIAIVDTFYVRLLIRKQFGQGSATVIGATGDVRFPLRINLPYRLKGDTASAAIEDRGQLQHLYARLMPPQQEPRLSPVEAAAIEDVRYHSAAKDNRTSGDIEIEEIEINIEPGCIEVCKE